MDRTYRINVYITHMRRGIWLCQGKEDQDGTEEWDAYGTFAAAKRWCANYCGVERLSWKEYAPRCFSAYVDLTDDI